MRNFKAPRKPQVAAILNMMGVPWVPGLSRDETLRQKHISCCIFVAILVLRHKHTLLDKSSKGQLTIQGSKFHCMYQIV